MPSSAARRLVVHYHLFKNAGSSLDRALQESLGSTWASYDSADPGAQLTFDGEVGTFLNAHPDLQAISSHQLLPGAELAAVELCPLILVREPISRVRSAYLFEWQKQPALDRPRGTLAQYVRAKLGTGPRSVIGDFQVNRISEARYRSALAVGTGLPFDEDEDGDGDEDAERRARVELAVGYIESLPVFGLVERFDDSIRLFNRELTEFLPGINPLRVHRANVLQGTELDPGVVRLQVRSEIGDDLYEELVARNEGDIELYLRARARFRELVGEELVGEDAPTDRASATPPRAIDLVQPAPPTTDPAEVGGRCIIVLGMHRSGTGALAGSLQAAGVELGEVGLDAPDNPKGNRESRDVIVLHDDLLHVNGGTWDDPVAPLHWRPIHRHFRDLFVERFRDEARWGFKDPRTLLALKGWLQALPGARPVGIFRHPFAVAHSLHRRDGIAPEDGLALWMFYNRVLLWWHDHLKSCGRALPLIEFHFEADTFDRVLEVLLDELGLERPTSLYFNDELRPALLPDLDAVTAAPAALALYQRLRSAAGFATTDRSVSPGPSGTPTTTSTQVAPGRPTATASPEDVAASPASRPRRSTDGWL